MNLQSPITRVPKIGPKYAELLEKLGIKTVEDLLYHFPFRYDDFSQIKNISEIQIGETCTLKVTLEGIDNIFTRNGKKFTKAIFSDETGKIFGIWYNQHYIKNSFEVGTKYNLSGKVTTFTNKLAIISPQSEAIDKNTNTARLVPIYPETYGISSKWLRARINDILSAKLETKEFLPEFLLKEHKYISREEALNKIHFPNSPLDESKAKERFAYEEMFLELLQVLERKKDWQTKLKAPKISNKKFRNEISNLIKNLPFELSKSQSHAIEEIMEDLEKSVPMNRLLEGDVGSGKTIVAVVISYLTYLNGYKTLYMAPTEILANQHLETFKKLLTPLGINVQLKTGSTKAVDLEADILIGTHALIYLEEKMSQVGLIIIDEQHRFGVSQRAKLLDMGSNKKVPHLLTMTATPIPRTLALTIYGDLEICNLEMPENKLKNTKTWVLNESKRADALTWVSKQNKPTFIVCPLIEQSEHESLENVKAAEVEFERLKDSFFKGKKIGLLHGRMNSKEKQQAIEDFRQGKIQILVSTPVIEVGVDIPDASIIVIESADRYGLASLHQLRGRVGRQGQESFCIIFSSSKSAIPINRLKNLEKYDSGLKLAEIDFSLRGQGNLYGTQQHGYVSFKIADLSNVELLEQAKKDAIKCFDALAEYPDLQTKLKEKVKNIGLVESN